MTPNQVDYLNIGLMGASLVAAFILPFEVFLFSYAILGPLHYLTEISWLHDRNYFSPRKFDWVPLTVLGILILLGGGKEILGEDLARGFESMGLGNVLGWLDRYVYDITFVAFGLAFVFVVFKEWPYRIASIFVLLLAAYIFALPEPPPVDQINTRAEADTYIGKYDSPFFKIFAVYLPTLIHVYLFTGAFILFGALKRNGRVGYASFAVFIACAIACFLVNPSIGYVVSEWAEKSYGNFGSLNKYLVNDLGGQDLLTSGGLDVFHDPLSIKFARFIAFAYTYHYLNWFSKTSVIRWHKVPKLRFVAVIVAWAVSIGLYIYSYKLGFRWLFLLSFLHVLLEFPLNHQSFIGIGKEITARVKGRKVAVKS